MIAVWLDGACYPNPGGHGGIGVVVRQTDAAGRKKVLYQKSKYIGFGKHMSNNVAEYEALIAGLRYIRENGFNNGEEIIILSDSMLVVKQMTNKMGVGGGLYARLFPMAKQLAFGLNIKFVWVPREKNWQANDLAVKARQSGEERGRMELAGVSK